MFRPDIASHEDSAPSEKADDRRGAVRFGPCAKTSCNVTSGAYLGWQIRAHDISCNFEWVPGYLHAPLRGHGGLSADQLAAEAKLARELGITQREVDR